MRLHLFWGIRWWVDQFAPYPGSRAAIGRENGRGVYLLTVFRLRQAPSPALPLGGGGSSAVLSRTYISLYLPSFQT